MAIRWDDYDRRSPGRDLEEEHRRLMRERMLQATAQRIRDSAPNIETLGGEMQTPQLPPVTSGVTPLPEMAPLGTPRSSRPAWDEVSSVVPSYSAQSAGDPGSSPPGADAFMPRPEAGTPSPTLPPAGVAPGPRDAARVNPLGLPDAYSPSREYTEAEARYNQQMREPAHKQGKAAQIGYQIAQIAQNFARGMQGQPMQDQKWLGEAKREYRQGKATRDFAPYAQEHMRRKEAAIEAIKMRGMMNDAAMKELEALRAVNPGLAKQIESAIANKYVTPELVEEAKKNGFGHLIPYDRRQVETKTVAGKTYERPEGSQGPWTESTLPEKKSEREIPRTLPSGEEFYTTGDREADRQINVGKSQAQIDDEEADAVARSEEQYLKDQEQYKKDVGSFNEQKAKLESEAGVKETEATGKASRANALKARADAIAGDDPDKAAELRDKAAELEAEAGTASAAARGLRDQAAKLASPSAPTKRAARRRGSTLRGTGAPRRVSIDQLKRLQQKTGKSLDELKRMAQKEGYTIN